MDVDLAQVGVLLGTGLATYMATWATQMRPLDKRLRAQEPVAVEDLVAAAKAATAEEVQKLRDEVTKLNEKAATCAKDHGRHEECYQRMEDRLRECVRSEEFQAFVATANGNIQSIVEKLAHTIGAIETWRRASRESTRP